MDIIRAFIGVACWLHRSTHMIIILTYFRYSGVSSPFSYIVRIIEKIKNIIENEMRKSFMAWWNTDCEFCKKSRLLIFWLILMLIADAMWFHLLF